MDLISTILGTGAIGVGLAQLITALNPASWWASGILAVIKTLLESLAGSLVG